MKMPNKCPFCNGVLLNKYTDCPDKTQYLNKVCGKSIFHKEISFRACARNEDYIDIVSLKLSNKLKINWYPFVPSVLINSITGTSIKLSYFEPDFTNQINYTKLINKIKIYMVFL
jgi:hypothetical protein